MKFKWVFLFVLALALVCIFGYRLDSEQLRTSLMAAIHGGHAEAATSTLKYGSVQEDSQTTQISMKSADSDEANKLVKTSLEAEDMRASLIKAVRDDNTQLAKKLIKLGADVNSRSSVNGWSALHYAVRNGNAQIVELLLEAGADPNYLGTLEGQKKSPVSIRPLVLAEAALDLVNQVPSSDIEDTLRQSGLDDPALVKSMTDPNASDRYKKIVDVLTSATKES